MAKKEINPGYKRKELFNKIFNKKKFSLFLNAWFGDVLLFPKSLVAKIKAYIKPQDKTLKKRWY